MSHPLQSSWRLVHVSAVALTLMAQVGLAQEQTIQTGVRFDLESLSKVPAVFPAEDISAEGVKAFFYEGAKLQGKPLCRLVETAKNIHQGGLA